MTVEADLFNTLKTLVANRVYPDVAPQGVVKPYIVYSQVGGDAPTFIERALPSKKNGRFQIDVWGDSRSTVNALALQVEQAMTLASVFDAKPLSAPRAPYEEDTQLRGSSQDFSVWSDR